MHITLESDYAVRIVECLAGTDQRIDAKRIAEQTGVTPRFTLKILHKLTSAGLLRSYQGAKGGYALAKPAGEITLREVIETVEGVYTFSRCLDPGHVCSCSSSTCRSGCCRFQKTYDEISELVRQKLSEITFAPPEKG